MMLLAEVTGRVMAEHQQQTIEPLLKRIE